MKTVSEICRAIDEGTIPKSRIYEVEADTIHRMYKAHQRALDVKVMLEAKVASLELRLEMLDTKEKIIYG